MECGLFQAPVFVMLKKKRSVETGMNGFSHQIHENYENE